MSKACINNRDTLSEKYLDLRFNKHGPSKEFDRAKQFSDVELKEWFRVLDEKRNAIQMSEKQRLASIRERSSVYQHLIAAGEHHTVGLKDDGTVMAVGAQDYGYVTANYGQCKVSEWKDIVAIAAGGDHTAGLMSDGKVVSAGSNYNNRRAVSSWTDIVAISANEYHTIGLRSDGTVAVTGDNDHGQCNVSNWKNIVAVAGDWNHTVGLKSDGTVVAVGSNEYGQCDVSDWTDIISVAAGHSHTVGLKSDGTVVVTVYKGNFGNDNQYGVSKWKDIIAIAANDDNTYGLQSNGTIVVNGHIAEGDILNWKNIVAIAVSSEHIVGLTSSGKVRTGRVKYGAHKDGKLEVDDWKLFRSEKEKEAAYNIACTYQKSDIEDNLKKAKELFGGLKNYKDSAERAEACCKAYKELKSAREDRERAEAERERAEEAARKEKERDERITSLNTEKTTLQTELSNLKGFFSGKRRKEINARLAQIEDELKRF